ncbi:TPA: hypothetical protein ACKPYC_001454 [Pseudomonas aeruginosa]|jgi:hypothetical protein|uniref:hypothetical protein n=1 Tax=Pseudomonas aeruginosa TaxID=287 RepID=UPI00053D71B3|nr:hypothetical protein [Pseudomonas aeruginosa]AYW42621.1 hypothetical protein DL351_25565 [Pseudomonas aeruginosa]KAB0785470.1 hypothetical protein F7O87_22895 [Pseudomonas aeruginosa]MBG6737912.1 hypothetical protein [Pseudomonas aeruginosa]MBH3789984.1 hypothetical protein [Pseudomonas aeruginosa]MBI7317284.1 hypothetical protein [Pseudomonas aeruginosa]
MTLRLAPLPGLDTALLLQQGEILEHAALMIESATASQDEIEELRIRAEEYCVLADSGRIALVPGTAAKLRAGADELKQMIRDWRQTQQDLAEEIADDRA